MLIVILVIIIVIEFMMALEIVVTLIMNVIKIIVGRIVMPSHSTRIFVCREVVHVTSIPEKM
jgi:hypothetical protein